MVPTYIYEFINDIYFHDAIKHTETHSGDTYTARFYNNTWYFHYDHYLLV